MTTRSIHEPAFHAASTPIGIAARTATIRVEIVKVRVGSTRWAISFETGRLVKIEIPRSPCSIAQTQMQQRENEERHDRHNRDRRQNAPDDISEHRASLQHPRPPPILSLLR